MAVNEAVLLGVIKHVSFPFINDNPILIVGASIEILSNAERAFFARFNQMWIGREAMEAHCDMSPSDVSKALWEQLYNDNISLGLVYRYDGSRIDRYATAYTVEMLLRKKSMPTRIVFDGRTAAQVIGAMRVDRWLLGDDTRRVTMGRPCTDGRYIWEDGLLAVEQEESNDFGQIHYKPQGLKSHDEFRFRIHATPFPVLFPGRMRKDAYPCITCVPNAEDKLILSMEMDFKRPSVFVIHEVPGDECVFGIPNAPKSQLHFINPAYGNAFTEAQNTFLVRRTMHASDTPVLKCAVNYKVTLRQFIDSADRMQHFLRWLAKYHATDRAELDTWLTMGVYWFIIDTFPIYGSGNDVHFWSGCLSPTTRYNTAGEVELQAALKDVVRDIMLWYDTGKCMQISKVHNISPKAQPFLSLLQQWLGQRCVDSVALQHFSLLYTWPRYKDAVYEHDSIVDRYLTTQPEAYLPTITV
jgi:hypothetical protein